MASKKRRFTAEFKAGWPWRRCRRATAWRRSPRGMSSIPTRWAPGSGSCSMPRQLDHNSS